MVLPAWSLNGTCCRGEPPADGGSAHDLRHDRAQHTPYPGLHNSGLWICSVATCVKMPPVGTQACTNQAAALARLQPAVGPLFSQPNRRQRHRPVRRRCAEHRQNRPESGASLDGGTPNGDPLTSAQGRGHASAWVRAAPRPFAGQLHGTRPSALQISCRGLPTAADSRPCRVAAAAAARLPGSLPR
eukprot:365847-Chlamydomonas_euryale.AAC.7